MRMHIKKHLRILFQRPDEYGLCIKPSKCAFGVLQISFLGYEITSNGLKPVLGKVEVINNFPEPKSSTSLRRFLRMVNSYHRFIPNCAKIHQPLTEMLKGHKKNNTKPLFWTEESKTAFMILKEALYKDIFSTLCS
ncbi:uncharacterized protein TNIN_341461 [Trichonephila inaurata madagascariensis]|uniref:Uncharacterized protein n=1 Tax=Trichonephila inaurata madagascariensis TaxID=2747483 RepID=A0A8X7CKY4_9ARAC|nr:uncharacterized protein TNIN_341461 [Trichonephila inaurata madagascariensis]